MVEHAYPSSLVGWLVLVLKRHTEALHDLSAAEAAELGMLQGAVARALHSETGCAKTYSLLLAEAAGFNHVHVHLVPRAEGLGRDRTGVRIFGYLKSPPEEVASPEEVDAFCRRARLSVSAEVKSAIEGRSI